MRILCMTTIALAATLSACGGGGGAGSSGGGSTTPTGNLTGQVADGPLSGALVCYDLNDNGACDVGEPQGTTNAQGLYGLQVDAAVLGQHAVIAVVPATAVDADTGAAVGTGFTLVAPPTGSAAGPVFVSPLTTLVAIESERNGRNVAAAALKVQTELGLPVSPLANFVASGNTEAATMARTVNTLVIEVTRLAEAAGVSPAQTEALVESLTRGDLPALAARVDAASGTPAQIAASVAAGALGDRNISSNTVAEAAELAEAVAAPPVATPAGPFLSVRRFTYAGAGDYSFQVFRGDSSVTDGNGAFLADELRSTVSGGAEVPFNRNQAYWNGSAWVVCERSWQVVSTVAQTANEPQRSVYCGASKSESRIVLRDIGDQNMSAVITDMRAFPLPDAVGTTTNQAGLPVNWGPTPSLLPPTAKFPAGSQMSIREHVNDVGNTDRYGLLDKVFVRYPDGSFAHARSFDDDFDRMTGDFNGGTASGGTTFFLTSISIPQPADTTLDDVAQFRMAINPDVAMAVRFYKCNVVLATGSPTNCQAVGDGTVAITTQGDARVARTTSGYPIELINRQRSQRFLVERNGAVFRGNTDLQSTIHNQRLNDVAFNALRDALGIPPLPDAVPPTTPGPTNQLRTFTYNDAANYSYRRFISGPTPGGDGRYVADDFRVNVASGTRSTFNFNSEFWTGSAWFDCMTGQGETNGNLRGVLTYTIDPRDSLYCDAFGSTSTAPVIATIDGRRMADVISDIRAYRSTDGLFSYANWGPNPTTSDAATALAATDAVFPPGSAMAYQTTTQTREPEQVFLSDTPNDNRLRIAPSPTSSEPFANWPQATTLEEVIAAYSGSLRNSSDGTVRVNGNTTQFVFRYTAAAPLDAALCANSVVEIRVAFDPAGQKARFTQNCRNAAGGSTAYSTVLDTTYAITTKGANRVLDFVQTPQVVLDLGGLERVYVQRAGEVRFGQRTRIWPGGQHTIRLNGTAWEALRARLGLVTHE